jgi:hypothetical protein
LSVGSRYCARSAPPKTENSVRDVPINDDTVAEFGRWKERQLEQRRLLGREWKDLGFVFTTEYGSPLSGTTLGRAWKRVMRAAGRCPW